MHRIFWWFTFIKTLYGQWSLSLPRLKLELIKLIIKDLKGLETTQLKFPQYYKITHSSSGKSCLFSGTCTQTAVW